MNPQKLIAFILAWSLALLFALFFNYWLSMERAESRHHAAVEASMVPPSTNNVRTH
jgi:cbb3-type cytochrome oxidase subunit 3